MANVLEIIIRATDAASAPIGGVVSRLNAASGAFQRVGMAASAAGAAITGSLTAAVFSAKNYGSEVDKIAKMSGVAVEAVQELGYAALQEHADMQTLANGLRRLSFTMAEAARGSAAAKRPFEMLGISVINAAGQLRPAEEIILELSDRFKELPDGPMKAALAMQIFGRAGAGLVPFLSMGRTEMEKLRQEARELGLVMSQEQVDAAKKFDDALVAVTSGIKGFALQIGSQLIPVLQPLVERIISVIKAIVGWMQANPGLTRTIVAVAAVIGALLAVVGPILVALGALGGAIAGISAGLAAMGTVVGAVGAVLAALAGPVGIVIAVVAALAAIVWVVIRNWSAIKSFFSETWEGLKIIVTENWDAILAVLLPFIGIPRLIIKNWDLIKGFFVNLWTGIVDFFASIIQRILGFATNAGRGLIMAFVNGVKAVASAPFNLLRSIFERIRRLLPFSDAAEGPLSNLMRSGGQFAETFAQGITARAGAIQSAVEGALAVAAPGALPVAAAAAAAPAGVVRIGGGAKRFTIDVQGAVEVVLDEVARGLVTS